jgi:hypothetical protein
VFIEAIITHNVGYFPNIITAHFLPLLLYKLTNENGKRKKEKPLLYFEKLVNIFKVWEPEN